MPAHLRWGEKALKIKRTPIPLKSLGKHRAVWLRPVGSGSRDGIQGCPHFYIMACPTAAPAPSHLQHSLVTSVPEVAPPLGQRFSGCPVQGLIRESVPARYRRDWFCLCWIPGWVKT